MGAGHSKEELLFKHVTSGDIGGIKALHRDGASLEWVDKEGRTPLMMACMIPSALTIVETLLDLGANIDAFRPGTQNGTPLHHAAKKGLDQTVDLLLSRGANPYRLNDGSLSALDLARKKHFRGVVRTIEDKICHFSGWLRLIKASSILKTILSSLFTTKVWAVVLPLEHAHSTGPRKFDLAMYSDLQVSEPCAIIHLWKAKIHQPDFNELDPVILIQDKKTRYKLLPANEGDKQQSVRFYNACKGIRQQVGTINRIPNRRPPPSRPSTGPPSASEDDEFALAIEASIQSAAAEGVSISKSQPTDRPHNDLPSTSSRSENIHVSLPSEYIISSPIAAPSAPPATEHVLAEDPDGNVSASGSCVICLDAAVEGACVPCGHMVGCMSCLNEIKSNNWGCPVCRCNIDQVVRIYAV